MRLLLWLCEGRGPEAQGFKDTTVALLSTSWSAFAESLRAVKRFGDPDHKKAWIFVVLHLREWVAVFGAVFLGFVVAQNVDVRIAMVYFVASLNLA